MTARIHRLLAGPFPQVTITPHPSRAEIAAMVTASQARALVQSRRGK